MDLKTYLSKLPAEGRADLARECAAARGHLQNIAYGYRECGPRLATLIEQRTDGAVTRKELRPTDWHLIWPELAEAA